MLGEGDSISHFGPRTSKLGEEKERMKNDEDEETEKGRQKKNNT